MGRKQTVRFARDLTQCGHDDVTNLILRGASNRRYISLNNDHLERAGVKLGGLVADGVSVRGTLNRYRGERMRKRSRLQDSQLDNLNDVGIVAFLHGQIELVRLDVRSSDPLQAPIR